MRNTSKAVSPFYEWGPGAQTPFPSMLMDQLNLCGQIYWITLVAKEILSPKASPVIPAARASPPLTPEFPLAKRSHRTSDRFASPYPMRVARTCSQSTVFLESPACSMPPSESGHGGYKLYDVLNWSPKAYAKFKKYMHDVINNDLETKLSASAQSPEQFEIVQNKAAGEFPDLQNYVNLWQIDDIILTRLKYTSQRARQKEEAILAGQNTTL
ncbi:hypothetical protein EV702DRAFT_1202351 [Suillus placidus]|uniref:Uncharacterized protein n=1 Tax=Suillus placidus TaxID=48579 RepID=A0A9P6ZKW6_9AGAM|nr:hypothetical protein EV702DRAFT_1202351 [Suillus placidus]